MFELRSILQYNDCALYLKKIANEVDSDAVNSFFVATINPIKTAVITIYLNRHLAQIYSFIKVETEKINQAILDIVCKIINGINNQREIELMLLDPTYFGREVLELIMDMRLTQILECEVLDNILSDFWKGPYE